MHLARNEKQPKNGHNPFCPSTKNIKKRAKGILVVA